MRAKSTVSLGFLYDIEQRCNSRDPQKDRYSSSAPSASGAKVFDSTHIQQRVETTQLSPATSRGHGDAHGINGWTAASPFIFVRFASAQQPVRLTGIMAAHKGPTVRSGSVTTVNKSRRRSKDYISSPSTNSRTRSTLSGSSRYEAEHGKPPPSRIRKARKGAAAAPASPTKSITAAISGYEAEEGRPLPRVARVARKARSANAP